MQRGLVDDGAVQRLAVLVHRDGHAVEPVAPVRSSGGP